MSQCPVGCACCLCLEPPWAQVMYWERTAAALQVVLWGPLDPDIPEVPGELRWLPSPLLGLFLMLEAVHSVLSCLE